MKKIFNLKTLFHFFAISIIALSVFFTFFEYDFVVSYFAELVHELGEALSFFGKNLIGQEVSANDSALSNNAVEAFSSKFKVYSNLDFSKLAQKFEKLKDVFFSKTAFAMYNYFLLYYFIFFLLIFFIVFFVFMIFEIVLENYLFSPSPSPGEETEALIKFKRYILTPCKKVIHVIKSFFKSFFSVKFYKLLFIAVWLFNFNVINISLEILCWYFVFPFDASFVRLFNFLLKLLYNVIVALIYIPWYVTLTLFLILFYKFRIKIGMLVLYHHQEKNKAFIKDSAKDLLITGPIRFGKTRVIVYLSLISEIVFREQSYDSIYKFKREFPDFPFWKLERELDEAISSKKIKGPHSAAKFIKVKRRIFERTSDIAILYGYEGSLYFNDSCRYCYLFDELEEFAKVYFVYSLRCSMIVSNLSIRLDSEVVTIGNFPLIDDDMLSRKAEDFDEKSRFCKNLDWDILRYGTHMDENNKLIGSYEFGINVYTENDKERGNKLTNAHLKITDEGVNPLNDKLSIGMKTIGHASTYDFKTYYISLADSQRSDSLNADERELRDKLTIKAVINNKLTLPFYIEGLFVKKMNDFFKKFDKELSYYGNEAFTLPSYILNHIVSAIHNYGYRVSKTFGYSEYRLSRERACNHDTGVQEEVKLCLPHKIIHNNRYATDSFNSFFGELSEKTPFGIADYPEYSSLKPTFEELDAQHSRLIEELKNNFKIDEE